jgi:hypothetical protein
MYSKPDRFFYAYFFGVCSTEVALQPGYLDQAQPVIIGSTKTQPLPNREGERYKTTANYFE